MPKLVSKNEPSLLKDTMVLFWTGKKHNEKRSIINYIDNKRPYEKIVKASQIAVNAIEKKNLSLLQ